MDKFMLRISISLLQKRRYMDKIFYKRSVFDFKMVNMEVVSSLSYCLMKMMDYMVLKKDSVLIWLFIKSPNNSSISSYRL